MGVLMNEALLMACVAEGEKWKENVLSRVKA